MMRLCFRAPLKNAALLALLVPVLVQAKNIGADPPNRCTTCNRPAVAQRSDTSSALSKTEGNVVEQVRISTTRSTNAPTVDLVAVYNSYNADGSRATLDTVMGYGWTHSFNLFLFTQFGAMFLYDGQGRVVKFGLGAGGVYNTATGYFETLVKTSPTTFTLTQKDQTVFTFSLTPTAPFVVGGPVWRLMTVVDRNHNTTTLSYTAGNMTGITDTYGRTTTFTYGAQNTIASITDPAGRVTTFTYDSTNRMLTQIMDPNGKTIHYTYNSLYQLTNKVDKAGRTFTYTYSNGEPTSVQDGAGTSPGTLSNSGNFATNQSMLSSQVTRTYIPATTIETDGRGNTWQYQYDSNGYLLESITPDSKTTTYTYDPNTLMTASITDANGHTTSYVYNSEGDMTQMTDALGHVTSYTYDSIFNNVLTMTDPLLRVTTYTYDANGNRLVETDPLGQTKKWTYDSNGNVLTSTDKDGNTTINVYTSGNLTQTTDPVGNVTKYTYDAVGNMISMTDPRGNTTQYQYDGMDRLILETDALSHTTQTFYDGEGNRIETIDRNGHATTYTYDLRQREISMTDALGKTETYAYDADDNRISTTDRNGHTTTSTYDVQDRLITVTDALSDTTTTTYDAVGNVLTVTDANGHTTTNTYDSLNRKLTETDAAGDLTQFQYDAGVPPSCPTVNPPCGATPGSAEVTEQIDADNNITYFYYDEIDRLIEVLRPLGAAIQNTYDPVGNRLSMTEPDGNKTTWMYDADNRRVEEINQAGDTAKVTYDPDGNVLTTTMPNQNVTTNTYDVLDRLIGVADLDGTVTTYTYDNEANRLTQTDANGNTISYTYDAINRITVITDPLTKTTTYVYDNVGNPTSTIDRNGNTTIYTYDAINRRITSTDALSETNQFTYDRVGNLIMLTDADGNVTQYNYDPVNRLLKETYADGTDRTLTYDGVGNVLTRTDEKGQLTTYSYNSLYFMTQRAYTTTPTDTYTYDLSGRVLSAQHGPGGWPLSFTWDGGDRILTADQNGHPVTYSYNIPGRTRTLNYPGGRLVTEYTDYRSRLDHILDTSSSTSITQYTYDAADRVLSRAYPRNGTSAAFTYNANNWILSLQHTGPVTIEGFNYTYDNEANKLYQQRLFDTAHSETYQYDAVYRLIQYKVGTLTGSTISTPSTQTSYNLDKDGNWVSKTTNSVTQNRTHNNVNELTQINSTNLTYDANGNLLNDGTYTYAYDAENRLLTVTQISPSQVMGQYEYDALGRRVQKIASPTGTPSTTQYFYDAARIVEEQDGSGDTLATYVYGNFVDEVLTMHRAGNDYYYHENAMHSIEAITNSSGTPVERYTYDAYGAVTVTDGSLNPIAPNSWGTPHSAIGNPYTFTGQRLDEETGLYYYRARMYDPAKGRFLQRDPLDYTDSMNLYEYAKDNPLTFMDPLGTDANPYSNMTQEDLMKLYEKLVYGKPGLEILSRMDPQSDWAKRYNITPDKINEAKKKLESTSQQIEEVRKELDRRQNARRQAAQACPAVAPGAQTDPCGIYWVIMNIAGEFDVFNDAVKSIETIALIGSLGAYGIAKPATAAGTKLTREAIKKWLADNLKEQLKKAALKGGRKLLENVLDPEKACFALAECETLQKGNGAGYWYRMNALKRVIRDCTWNNGTATWHKFGLRDILPRWLGGY